LTTDAPDWRKSRLRRALTAAAQKVAEEWDQVLASAVGGLTEHPGRRLAAAEAALETFQKYCVELAQAHRGRLDHHAQKTQKAWQHLEDALAGCLAGAGGAWGFQALFFGNRSRRLLRVFMDHLAAFARQRLIEEVAGSAQQFFAILHGRLEDRLRELAFTRQRLRHLQECLESPAVDGDELAVTRYGTDTTLSHSPLPSAEAFWETIRQSATAHVVLPGGEDDLERAAGRFLSGLTIEHWTQLDQVLQDQVLGPLGGLQQACSACADLTRNLAAPLVDRAAACLGEHLPVMDVAQVQFTVAGERQMDVMAQARECLDRANPLVRGKDETNQQAFLLVPGSDAGKAFGDQSRKAIPRLNLVRVPGQADLMFCCEQGCLTVEDLQRLLGPCRPAYEALSGIPHSSPHARCDILDWVPLDP
jgi:hypothetical protein